MSRVMITVPDELLSEIDQAAQLEHRSRSELIREAMRHYLKQQRQSARSSALLAPIEAAGIIERLRTQAEQRAHQARDTTDIIRSFRGELDDVDHAE